MESFTDSKALHRELMLNNEIATGLEAKLVQAPSFLELGQKPGQAKLVGLAWLGLLARLGASAGLILASF